MSGQPQEPQQFVLQPVVTVQELGVPRVELPNGQKVPILTIAMTLQVPLPEEVAKAMGADLLAGSVTIASPADLPKGPLQ